MKGSKVFLNVPLYLNAFTYISALGILLSMALYYSLLSQVATYVRTYLYFWQTQPIEHHMRYWCWQTVINFN